MLAGKKIKGKLAVAGAVKKVVLKKKVPIKSKSAPQTGGSKVERKPVKCHALHNKSEVEEAGGVHKSTETIVTELVSHADEVTEELAIAGENIEETVPLECTDAQNQSQTGDSKLEPKPVTSETVDNKSAVPEVERGGVHKSVKTTSAKSAPNADTGPEKLAITGGNTEESVPLECTDAENQPRTGGSKLEPKPVTSETVEVGGEKLFMAGNIHEEGMPVDAENQPDAGQNKNRPVSGTCASVKEMVFNPDSKPDPVTCIKTEDGEPMQREETQEVSSGTFLKREKSPPLDTSVDEPSRKAAAPSLETPPPVKASQHAEPNLPGAPQSTAETPEIKTEVLDVQQSDDGLKAKREGRLDTWPHAST